MDKPITPAFKFDINALIGLMIFSLPLSVKLFFRTFYTEVIYPSEIFIALLAVYFFYDLYQKKLSFFVENRNFFRHPLTILVCSYLAVNLLSAGFSTMPLVSLKAVIVKSCYILVFYFMTFSLIKSTLNNFSEMIKIYGIALSAVVIYSLVHHFEIGLYRGNAGYASHPFYADHTIYGAALAFVIPAFVAFFFFPKLFDISNSRRYVILLATLLFIAGLYFSFCRAAWISITVCLGLLLLIKTKLSFYSLIIGAVLILSLTFFNRHSLINSFKLNKNNSYAYDAGLYEQVFSLTNITNDPSNAERLNRWSCAARMFRDKPLLGFGPGTYQFKYLTYQRKKEMTQISMAIPLGEGETTYSWSTSRGFTVPTSASAWQGSGGTAHSEYFLALSETGLFSFLILIALYLYSLYSGMKIYAKSTDKKIKVIATFTLLGLTTYFVHALFNNFLDDGKLAFLFWTFLSAMAAIDISWKQKGITTIPAKEDKSSARIIS